MCSLSLCTFKSFWSSVKLSCVTTTIAATLPLTQAGLLRSAKLVPVLKCDTACVPWLELEWPSSSVIKILASSAASCRAAWCLAGAGSGDNTETRAGSETGEAKVDNVAGIKLCSCATTATTGCKALKI